VFQPKRRYSIFGRCTYSTLLCYEFSAKFKEGVSAKAALQYLWTVYLFSFILLYPFVLREYCRVQRRCFSQNGVTVSLDDALIQLCCVTSIVQSAKKVFQPKRRYSIFGRCTYATLLCAVFGRCICSTCLKVFQPKARHIIFVKEYLENTRDYGEKFIERVNHNCD
jgi:hypothetical protein